MILHIYFLCSLIFTLITMILKLFLDWLSLIKFSWNVTLHSQKLQGYLITIWTDSICIFRLPCVVALYWHWAQKYLTFFWAASMWVFRSSIVVYFCSQLLQMNCFYMSLQTSLAWCFIFTLITETFDFPMDWFNLQCDSLDLPLLFVFVHTYYQWTVSICLFKPPWLGALYPHW